MWSLYALNGQSQRETAQSVCTAIPKTTGHRSVMVRVIGMAMVRVIGMAMVRVIGMAMVRVIGMAMVRVIGMANSDWIESDRSDRGCARSDISRNPGGFSISHVESRCTRCALIGGEWVE